MIWEDLVQIWRERKFCFIISSRARIQMTIRGSTHIKNHVKEVLATAMSINTVDTTKKSEKSELLFFLRTLFGVNCHLLTCLVWEGMQEVVSCV